MSDIILDQPGYIGKPYLGGVGVRKTYCTASRLRVALHQRPGSLCYSLAHQDTATVAICEVAKVTSHKGAVIIHEEAMITILQITIKD